ncbi:MAG: AgmX/PglI C-terminal domain-containing protein [Deltaproteobacteria bacterium]|nr:AgmX/PglI C-terminal domain-containing protein [Deltaproteobacteria bacterium]
MADKPSSMRPEARRLSPPPGDWLYKLQGEVIGPVPASEIVTRLFAGEVDESTQVRTEDGDWLSLQALAVWHPFIYQAKAKLRAEKARAEAEQAARRRKAQKMVNLGIGAVFLILISFAATYLLIVQRPGRDEETLREWAARHVPLFSLPVAKAAALDEGGEEAGLINIDQILIDDAPALVAIRNHKRKRRKRQTGKPVSSDKPKEPGADKPAETEVASTGMLTNEEITNTVYARSNIGRLSACLKAEIQRNPDLPGRVVLDFSIRNDGRIHSVRLDDARLEDGPLQACFTQKLAKLKFRPYQGQVRNVTIPFDWKR